MPSPFMERERGGAEHGQSGAERVGVGVGRRMVGRGAAEKRI